MRFAIGCGCGTNEKIKCGYGCGCGTNQKTRCGCGCGCGTNQKTRCGSGCGPNLENPKPQLKPQPGQTKQQKPQSHLCGLRCGLLAVCGCGCGCGCGARNAPHIGVWGTPKP